MPENILIAIAWPYANAEIHVGNITGSYLPGDIVARYHRLKGDHVLMVSGTDSHGTPVTIAADQEGIPVEQVYKKYHNGFIELFQQLGIQYDLFTTTHTENHFKVAQSMFLALQKNGFLFTQKSMQWYSPAAKRFLPDRYVEGTCYICGDPGARSDQCDKCGNVLEPEKLLNPKSKVDGSTPELRETEHFYLELSKLEPEVADFLRERSGYMRETVLGESLRKIEAEGLKPRPITRDLDWGIPVPVEGWDNKRLYVWFEAVIGYLSAAVEWAKISGNPDAWKDWWVNPSARAFYFIGKDNIFFHTALWPAELMGAGEQFLQIFDPPASPSRGGREVNPFQPLANPSPASPPRGGREENPFQPLANPSPASAPRGGREENPFQPLANPSPASPPRGGREGGALTMPYDVPANQFMNLEGQKISGSRNWAVWGRDALTRYDPDALRYYLTINMPENHDSDWDWKEFVARNNGELVATWGNLVNRVLSFSYKHWDGYVPDFGGTGGHIVPGWEQSAPLLRESDLNLLAGIEAGFQSVGALLEAVKLRAALQEAFRLATTVNQYLDQMAPWQAVKTDKDSTALTIYTALKAIDSLKVIFAPFLPFTCEKLNGFFGYETPLFGEPYTETVTDSLGEHTVLRYSVGRDIISSYWKPSELKPGAKLNPPTPLFKKLEESIIEAERARLGK